MLFLQPLVLSLYCVSAGQAVWGHARASWSSLQPFLLHSEIRARWASRFRERVQVAKGTHEHAFQLHSWAKRMASTIVGSKHGTILAPYLPNRRTTCTFASTVGAIEILSLFCKLSAWGSAPR